MSRVPAGITACRAATLSPKLSEDSFAMRCWPSRSVTIHRVAIPTISIDDRFVRTRAYLDRLSLPELEKKSARPEWRWLAYSSMDMEGSAGAVKFITDSSAMDAADASNHLPSRRESIRETACRFASAADADDP